MRISDWSSDVCSSDLIRGLSLLDSLSRRTRINLEVVIADAAALPALSDELEPLRGGRGEVMLRLSDGTMEAVLNLGRKYVLDAEVAARLEYVKGVDRKSTRLNSSH